MNLAFALTGCVSLTRPWPRGKKNFAALAFGEGCERRRVCLSGDIADR